MMQLVQGRVAINARKPLALVNHLDRDLDKIEGVGSAPLYDGIEDRVFGVEIRVGDLVPVHQNEVR